MSNDTSKKMSQLQKNLSASRAEIFSIIGKIYINISVLKLIFENTQKISSFVRHLHLDHQMSNSSKHFYFPVK